MRSREILANQSPQKTEIIDKVTKTAEKGVVAMVAGSVITLYVKPEIGLPLLVGGGVVTRHAYKRLDRLESANHSQITA
jgi:hypothetical protein